MCKEYCGTYNPLNPAVFLKEPARFVREMDDEIIRMLKAQVDANALICPDCGAKTQSTYLTPPDYNKFLIGCTKCEWQKLLAL
jgi:hypothetical protein